MIWVKVHIFNLEFNRMWSLKIDLKFKNNQHTLVNSLYNLEYKNLDIFHKFITTKNKKNTKISFNKIINILGDSFELLTEFCLSSTPFSFCKSVFPFISSLYGFMIQNQMRQATKVQIQRTIIMTKGNRNEEVMLLIYIQS